MPGKIAKPKRCKQIIGLFVKGLLFISRVRILERLFLGFVLRFCNYFQSKQIQRVLVERILLIPDCCCQVISLGQQSFWVGNCNSCNSGANIFGPQAPSAGCYPGGGGPRAQCPPGCPQSRSPPQSWAAPVPCRDSSCRGFWPVLWEEPSRPAQPSLAHLSHPRQERRSAGLENWLEGQAIPCLLPACPWRCRGRPHLQAEVSPQPLGPGLVLHPGFADVLPRPP